MSEQGFADLARRAREQVVTAVPPMVVFETGTPEARGPRWIAPGAAAAVVMIAVGVAGMRSLADAPAPAGPEVPTAGCSAMTVERVEPTGSAVLVVLRNTGSGACDARAMKATAVLLPSGSRYDAATAQDLGRWDGAVAPETEAVVRLVTWPACEFGGARYTLAFSDGAEVEFSDPEPALGECIEPGPRFEVAAVRPEPVSPVEVPAVVGLAYRDAQEQLRAAGLDVILARPGIPDLDGDVLEQSPAPGTSVSPRSEVTLTLAQIEYAFAIRNRSGQDLHITDDRLDHGRRNRVDIEAGPSAFTAFGGDPGREICRLMPLTLLTQEDEAFATYGGPCGDGEVWTIE